MEKILVVDDEKDVRDFLSEILMVEGFQVIFAADGQEALEIVRERKPDLVLLDIKIPKLDGWAVLQIIKSNHETKSIPVIMLTGMNEVIDRMTSYYLRADGYISKPFTNEELIKVINETLSDYKRLRELSCQKKSTSL
ncbi:MAG: response regulator [bacterium]